MITTNARRVVDDCEDALRDYADSANTPFQRSRWVAVITLLRTVLYVLQRVDHKATSDDGRWRIDDAGDRLGGSAARGKGRQRPSRAARRRRARASSEPHIFHDFIDDERNDVVHQYDLSARVSVAIYPRGIPWMPDVLDDREVTGTTRYTFEMKDAPFVGQDPRQLCHRAIEFWRASLDEIDGTP
jgi:hypothetical protein